MLERNKKINPILDILIDVKNNHPQEKTFTTHFLSLLNVLLQDEIETSTITENVAFSEISRDFPEKIPQIENMIRAFHLCTPLEKHALKDSAIYSTLTNLCTSQKRPALVQAEELFASQNFLQKPPTPSTIKKHRPQ